jgi:hypothetical protein
MISLRTWIRLICMGLAAVAVLVWVPLSAQAGFLYASELTGPTDPNNTEIVKVDTVSHQIVQEFFPTNKPDSLIFDRNNNIIYTGYYTGDIRRFDPTTGTDTLIANIPTLTNGQKPFPVDLLLDPSGNSVVVTTQGGSLGNKNIYRISLLDGSVLDHVFVSGHSGAPGGLAYGPNGRLFAILGNDTIAELNANLTTKNNNVGTGYTSLDGLTYDSNDGFLCAAVHQSGSNGGIWQIDPNNLNNATEVYSFSPTLNNPDGVFFDGNHSLYVAARGSAGDGSDAAIYILDTKAWTDNTVEPKLVAKVPWLDDIAPPFGSGSINLPEPGALTLAILGALGAVGYARNKRKQTA